MKSCLPLMRSFGEAWEPHTVAMQSSWKMQRVLKVQLITLFELGSRRKGNEHMKGMLPWQLSFYKRLCPGYQSPFSSLSSSLCLIITAVTPARLLFTGETPLLISIFRLISLCQIGPFGNRNSLGCTRRTWQWRKALQPDSNAALSVKRPSSFNGSSGSNGSLRLSSFPPGTSWPTAGPTDGRTPKASYR